jgi:RNA polymerase sigma factor (sigma-70 family)
MCADRRTQHAPRAQPLTSASTLTDLHRGALDGNAEAWNLLVARLQRVAWWALGSVGLSTEDRKDAFAAAFARLVESLPTIHDPECLPGWIATTATREGYAISRRQARCTPSAHLDIKADLNDAPPPGEALLNAELHGAVRKAFQSLSPECQRLLRLLALDPPLSYAEIAEVLGRPVGSIGPTRQRCLEQLRTKLSGYTNGGAS